MYEYLTVWSTDGFGAKGEDGQGRSVDDAWDHSWAAEDGRLRCRSGLHRLSTYLDYWVRDRRGSGLRW